MGKLLPESLDFGRRARVLVVYYGHWKGYDFTDPDHKWNQMVEGPYRSYDNDFGSVHVEDGDERYLWGWLAYHKPDTTLTVIHGDGLKDEVQWYRNLRQTCMGKIYALHIDCTTTADIAHAESIAPYVDGIINVDRHEPPKGVADPSKYLNFPCGYGKQWFYNANLERDIPCSFIGEYIGRVDRHPVVERLIKECGILTSQDLGLTVTHDHAARPSIRRYAQALQRSLLSINVPPHPTYPILNGRIWEALACGSCLVNLDYEGSPTKEVLVPDRDYVSAGSVDELVEKVNYYKQNTEEAASIARCGEKIFREKFSPELFWYRLHNQIGRDICNG
jgi:hypothetical protein